MLSSVEAIETTSSLPQGDGSTLSDQRLDFVDNLDKLLKEKLYKRYPEAKIDIISDVQWRSGGLLADIHSISLISESARGEVVFQTKNSQGMVISEGMVSFSAIIPAYIAIRRIQIGEKLSHDMFTVQEVNVASGLGREYRGIIMSTVNHPPDELSQFEPMQTVLEGKYLLTSTVKKVPDIKKGEPVRIKLISKEITLLMVGVAEEPAYLNGPVKVMAQKTKRQLTGRLLSGGIVEVGI